MVTLTIGKKNASHKVKIEVNSEQFERLASSLGFFGTDFLNSLQRAEHEIAHGKLKHLRSLRDLRHS